MNADLGAGKHRDTSRHISKYTKNYLREGKQPTWENGVPPICSDTEMLSK